MPRNLLNFRHERRRAAIELSPRDSEPAASARISSFELKFRARIAHRTPPPFRYRPAPRHTATRDDAAKRIVAKLAVNFSNFTRCAEAPSSDHYSRDYSVKTLFATAIYIHRYRRLWLKRSPKEVVRAPSTEYSTWYRQRATEECRSN